MLLLLWLPLPLSAQSELRWMPKSGDPSIYFDIDADGRLLKVDYLSEQASVLGSLGQDDLDRPFLPWHGWHLEDGRWLFLDLTRFISSGRAQPARLVVFEASGDLLRETSLVLELGEYAVEPFDSRHILIEYRDSARNQTQRFLFDASDNVIAGGFAEDLRWNAQIGSNDESLFFADPFESQVVALGKSKGIERKVSMSKIIETRDQTQLFVVGLQGQWALVQETLESPGPRRTRFALVDLSDESIAGYSDILPFFTGRFVLSETSDHAVDISCVTSA